MNQTLSTVLLDGGNMLEVDQGNTYYGKTAKALTKATNKIYNVGGYVSGALWAGANYITGNQADDQSSDISNTDLTVDKSGRITHEELEMIKEMDKFAKDEKLFESFLKHYSTLES